MKPKRKKSIRSLYDRWLVEGNGASLRAYPKGLPRRWFFRFGGRAPATSEASIVKKYAKRLAYRLHQGADESSMMSSRGSPFYEPKLRRRMRRKAKKLQKRFACPR